MKRRSLIIVVMILLLVVLGVPRVFLLPRIERELQKDLGGDLQARAVQVQIKAPWGWELLFGNIPRLELTAHDAVIDGLRVARVDLYGEQIRLDPRSLWQERELVYIDASKLGVDLVVTENSLNELLWSEVDPDRFLRLAVSPAGVDLGGTLSLWNMEWNITVRGGLEVRNGTSLAYVLTTFEVEETRIPSILLEVLSENYDLVIDFGVFPYPIEIKDVFLEEQQILVRFGGVS